MTTNCMCQTSSKTTRIGYQKQCCRCGHRVTKCWYAAFGSGTIIVPSNELWGPICSRGEGTSGGSDSTDHPGPQAPETSPESRWCFVSPQLASSLPSERSARRIIRNLFITLAALVSPTDRRKCGLLRLPPGLFDTKPLANVISGVRLYDLDKQQTGASS